MKKTFIFCLVCLLGVQLFSGCHAFKQAAKKEAPTKKETSTKEEPFLIADSDRKKIEKAIHKQSEAIGICTQNISVITANDDPFAKLNFTVSEVGKIKDLKITTEGFDSSKVNTCITEALEGLSVGVLGEFKMSLKLFFQKNYKRRVNETEGLLKDDIYILSVLKEYVEQCEGYLDDTYSIDDKQYELKFNISPDGKIDSFAAQGESALPQEYNKCLSDEIDGWLFYPTKKARVVTLRRLLKPMFVPKKLQYPLLEADINKTLDKKLMVKHLGLLLVGSMKFFDRQQEKCPRSSETKEQKQENKAKVIFGLLVDENGYISEKRVIFSEGEVDEDVKRCKLSVYGTKLDIRKTLDLKKWPILLYDTLVLNERDRKLGSLERASIRKVIRSKSQEIKYCYNKRLQDNPDIAGRIRVRFIINDKGVVEDIILLDNDNKILDEKMLNCIKNKVYSMRFPKPKGGGIVIVTYPFVFAPSY